MVQVLPYVPTFGESLIPSLNQAIGTAAQGFQQRAQNQNDQRILQSFDPNDSPVNQIQKFAQLSQAKQQALTPLFSQYLKTQSQQQMQTQKAEEAKAPIKSALETVERQRELLKEGHLGPKLGRPGQAPKLGSTLTKKGQKARAEYERLGKSLISMSSNIPIRNRQEFETLAADLYDPTLTEAQIEGSLDAMERIIKNQLGESTPSKKETKSTRPPLSEFFK